MPAQPDEPPVGRREPVAQPLDGGALVRCSSRASVVGSCASRQDRRAGRRRRRRREQLHRAVAMDHGDRAPVEVVVRRDVGRVVVGGQSDDELAPGERELLAALAFERRGHEPGRREGRRRERDRVVDEVRQPLGDLGVEHADHEPDRRVELPREERGVEVAQVVVAGQDERARLGDARLAQHALALVVADDDVDVRADQPLALVRVGRDGHDRLVAQAQLLDRAPPEVVQPADDDVGQAVVRDRRGAGSGGTVMVAESRGGARRFVMRLRPRDACPCNIPWCMIRPCVGNEARRRGSRIAARRGAWAGSAWAGAAAGSPSRSPRASAVAAP